LILSISVSVSVLEFLKPQFPYLIAVSMDVSDSAKFAVKRKKRIKNRIIVLKNIMCVFPVYYIVVSV